MANLYKILGQEIPTAGSTTTLYTTPASTNTAISTLTVSNNSATAGKARIWVCKSGMSPAPINALLYDVIIPPNSFTSFTIGITLNVGESIRVYSLNGGDLSFQAFGTEMQ